MYIYMNDMICYDISCTYIYRTRAPADERPARAARGLRLTRLTRRVHRGWRAAPPPYRVHL